MFSWIAQGCLHREKILKQFSVCGRCEICKGFGKRISNHRPVPRQGPDQAPDCQKYLSRLPRVYRQVLGHGQKVFFLHPEVIEVPKIVLQPLQLFNLGVDGVRVKQAGEKLHQISQFFAMNPQDMQHPIIGAFRNPFTCFHNAPVFLEDPARRQHKPRTLRLIGTPAWPVR
jgi:hypothetical protein